MDHLENFSKPNRRNNPGRKPQESGGARQSPFTWQSAVNGYRNYSQAPWRKQLQIIGLFSLVLVSIALVAGIYLNISARTAAVGRDIQKMQGQIETIDLEIEDLNSQLAMALSSDEMEARAYSMGFEPLQTDQIEYMNVQGLAGYVERQPAILAPYSEGTVISAPVLPPEYTESLFTWLRRQLNESYQSLVEVLP